jgi:hypothetical protein
MSPTGTPAVPAKEFAFYYPGPMWASARRMKNMLLFFDGIALLVPSYIAQKPGTLEPELVLPLEEKGLLKQIEPETAVDRVATEQLATALVELLVTGVLDALGSDDSEFHSLSWSRLGGYGDESLARMIHDELKKRNLAKDSTDGFSVPIHPLVRSLILVLLAQILRPYGATVGMDLCPATDRPQVLGALQEILNLHPAPSAGAVVSFDLETLGVDLSNVPLDEFLSFRTEHLRDYRRYARSVRQFVRDLSLTPSPERSERYKARREELRDLASSVNKSVTKAWKGYAKFGLGIAGAAWSLKMHNPLGAALGAGGAILGLNESKTETGAYSYIFKAKDSYA